MISRSGECRKQKIEEFIQGELDPPAIDALEDHLTDCPACRIRLEELAASRQTWDKTSAYLSDDLSVSDNLLDVPGLLKTGTDPHTTRDNGVDQVLESLAPTDDPQMLGRINGYEISGVIGSGGMGVVLKGYDPALKRVVAIKVLAPHLATSGTARKRFAREAQATAAITHDNVIDIHAVAEFGKNQPYLVMPFARGTSLQKRLDEHGPVSVLEAARIGMQIASGLAAAHNQGLVHRDIKPANILLKDGVDRLVITDFGLARAVDDVSTTRTGVIAGTPQFMSPEQARGDSSDHRSDLFSLGSVLYTLCTGRVPFRAETTFGVLRRITDNQPRAIQEINPSIPAWFCQIVAKLHEKNPEDRYQSAAELAGLLQQCVSHLQTPDVPLPEQLVPVPSSRRFALPMAGLAVVAVLAGLLTYGYLSSSRSKTNVKNDPLSHSDQFQSAPDKPADSSSQATNLQVANSREAVDQPTGAVTGGLTYQFHVGQEIAFHCLLELNHISGHLVAENLVRCRVVESENDYAELRYQIDAGPVVLDQKLAGSRHFPGAGLRTSVIQGERLAFNHLSKQGRFKISTVGGILGRSQECELPGQVGSLLDFLFPVISSDVVLVQESHLEVNEPAVDRISGPPRALLPNIVVHRTTETNRIGDKNGQQDYTILISDIYPDLEDARSQMRGSFTLNGSGLKRLDLTRETDSGADFHSSLKMTVQRVDQNAASGLLDSWASVTHPQNQESQ